MVSRQDASIDDAPSAVLDDAHAATSSSTLASRLRAEVRAERGRERARSTSPQLETPRAPREPRPQSVPAATKGFRVGVSVRVKPGGDYSVAGAIPPGVSQEEAAAAIGIADLVRDFVSGTDVCVLAYGQTGSGKTHTLLGPPGVLTERAIEESGGVPVEWGCWPRAVLTAMEKDGVELQLWAVEIYFDTVFDLLDGKKVVKTGGKIGAQGAASYMQSAGGQAQYDEQGKWIPPIAAGKDGKFSQSTAASKMEAVSGQSKVAVKGVEDVVRIGRTVEASRVAHSHALNHRSSRSHAVLGAELLRKVRGKATRSCMLFCDLAGSERIKKTGSEGLVQDEARSINSSLSALQRVVGALASKAKFVPYRDSALTTILKQAFGGNSRTHAVVTVSSLPEMADETRNSLRFAREMGLVENNVTKHKATSVESEQGQLRAELKAVKQSLRGVALGGMDDAQGKVTRQQFFYELEQFEHFRGLVEARKENRLEGKTSGDAKCDLEKMEIHRAAVERMLQPSGRAPAVFKWPPAAALTKYDRITELEQALAELGAPVEHTVLPESVALARRLRRIDYRAG